MLVVNLAGDPSGWEGLTVIEKVDGGGQMAPASHTVNGLEESLTIGVVNQGVKIVFAYKLYGELIGGIEGMNGLMIDAMSSLCLCAKSNLQYNFSVTCHNQLLLFSKKPTYLNTCQYCL